MRQRHVAAEALNARAILQSINAKPDQDFHTLRMSQQTALEEAAKKAKYHKPKNANGSTARYFFARLCRLVKMGEKVKGE